ncbi:PIN domain-containing protein [Aminobacter sp. HY435]|uniref:PIN domain-containing protein n=1 Tax=Aminobacter sp. HY435 TaxID=2970917 RepID=UPI0022B97B53|nr:PIN domain-containing protein [Aminobacter sp. HY435]
MAKPVVLDANLSILFAVGLTKEIYISKHKRLQGFDILDFRMLSEVVAASSGLLFLPNILSETSNLVRYVGDPIRLEVSLVLRQIIATSEEKFIPSKTASARDEYCRFGLTDAAILEMLTSGAVLYTVDLDLYLAALQANVLVENFNHLRDARPDFRN